MSVQLERPRVDPAPLGSHVDQGESSEDSGAPSLAWPRTAARKRVAVVLLLVFGAVLLIGAAATVTRDFAQPDQPLIFHVVARGDLPIVVTERGNLESQNNTDVYCDVDDIHGDGIHGTPILWIIPNGSSVEEGELLVELDGSSHQERLDQQILETEEARAEQIKASAKLENQKSQNRTAEEEAKLQVQLAELELKMFKDEEKGTHQLEVEEINRLIEDINNQILEAEANLELKRNDMLGVEALFKLGYAGKGELDRSRLEYLQAESQFAARLNKLKTQLATLKKKESYERQMQLLKLEGALASSQRALAQALLDNKALLDQAQAAAEAADEQFKKETELLERYGEQVENCKIYSPEDGMVAYAAGDHRWTSEVREGAPVRPRQKLLTLPNLTQMQIKTAVHESVLDQISPGLPATIRIDALHNTTYQGSVESVAVLPDQAGWMSSDTKVYQTIVTIDEPVENIKPGMTAVVEIHVERLRDVLSVPVQAIVQIEDDTWCYIESGGSVERCNLELGRTNDQFVEIREGLHEGDRVVLNPMALIEQTESSGEADAPENEPGDAAPLRDGHDH